MAMRLRTDDSELRTRNGQVFEILRSLTSDEADLDETGPMYRVKFPDGHQAELFADEVVSE